MQKAVIVSNDAQTIEECQSQISQLNRVELLFVDDLEVLERIENDYNFLFILIQNFNGLNLDRIFALQETFAAVPLILYGDSLIWASGAQLQQINSVHLLIGPKRAEFLTSTIQRISNSYWRNVPLEYFGLDRAALSERMQKAIRYVEEHRLNACTLDNLSEYLGMSPGYFAQEFKRETGFSFREFIQMVLKYYEDNIFPAMKISLKNMALVLGYSDLSSFSRSFKRRQGVSPVQFKKHEKSTKHLSRHVRYSD